MARMTIDFGIDLGTTNSAIAVADHGRVRIFKNLDQREHTPSVVRVDRAGTIHVGRRAYESLQVDPDNVHAEFKRLMGTSHQLRFAASGRSMAPEDLSAEVLKSLRADAARAGFECDTAVITVPAYFEIVACEATQRAAKAAGLMSAPLLQEPIAAAIAACRDLSDRGDGYWLVYDLGGGTFDVAIVGRRGGHLTIVDCAGDNHLGGKEFDWLIVDRLLVPRLREAFALPDLSRGNTKYRSLLAKLKKEAEEAKIALTEQQEATVYLDNCGQDDAGRSIELSVRFSRKDYEPLIGPLIDKTLGLCRGVLERARLNPSAVERLLLVGGPTMTPSLRSALGDGLSIPVETRLDPITVVAQGAAIYASSQLLPRDHQPRASGKIQVTLSFSPLCQQALAPIAGRVQEGSDASTPKGLRIQVTRDDGGWQSGSLGLNDGVFVCQVALREHQPNTFRIGATDAAGHAVPIEPDAFCVTHGLSVANPPLQRTIGVEIRSENGSGRFEPLLLRGTPLPAKQTRAFRTAYAVTPGSQEQPLNIHVYEGEHQAPEHNRHLGTLKVRGSQIRRPVPANADIEITLSIDTSRHPVAQAYIPLLDETFKEVLTETVAPKPDIDNLARELAATDVRWQNLTRSPGTGSAGTGEIDRQLTEATVELVAAQGGDPGALEKADRVIRELQAQIASLERAAALPTALRELDDALQSASKVVAQHGQAKDQEELAALERDGQRAREHRDGQLCRDATDRLWSLHWAVLTRHDGFWISVFQELAEADKFTDPGLARTLIAQGSHALQTHDMTKLREVTRHLWSLVPREVQHKTTRRASDAGLK